MQLNFQRIALFNLHVIKYQGKKKFRDLNKDFLQTIFIPDAYQNIRQPTHNGNADQYE